MVAVIAAAFVILLPTLKFYFFEDPGTRDKDKLIWPHRLINLGLDLQGGMHLVLEVRLEEAVKSALARYESDLRESFRRNGSIKFDEVEVQDDNSLRVRLSGQESYTAFEELLAADFQTLALDSSRVEGGNKVFILRLPRDEEKRVMESAVSQAVETIRNRIDQYGVSEPEIRRQGERRIVIQLPGVKDPERVKALLKKTAQLQFRLLDETRSADSVTAGQEPRGTEILYEVSKNSKTGRQTKTPLLVKKKVLLTGDYLKDARVAYSGDFNQPEVSIAFDKEGARLFGQITGENVGKRLAIVLDNTVYSAPTIQEKIGGGAAVITGSFTVESASDLALVLRAGALPASVEVAEERTVGASLGADSIRKGGLSMAAGLIIVVVFMVVYYRASGLNADLALVLNIVLLGAGLALFNATLTLPGIAGILLTMATAVDSNVLIYERTREELRLGKTPAAALDAGYDRATVTIVDANVTNIAAALVLLQFGTGPIKGFAITLSLGIASSMFTAIVVTRVIFDYFLYYRRARSLSI